MTTGTCAMKVKNVLLLGLMAACGLNGLPSMVAGFEIPTPMLLSSSSLSPLMELQSIVQHSVANAPQYVAHSYMNSLEAHPLLTKMATGGCLATCGDAIAQKQAAVTALRQKQGTTNEQAPSYDVRRAASFMTFDMVYRALQHVSFPWIVEHCQGQYFHALIPGHLPTEYLAAMEQTLASQLGIVPFLYYPVFFSMTGCLQGLSRKEALNRAQEKFVPLMKRNLLFWIPVQFIQFGFIDTDLQIPFLSMAGLCWTFILSAFAGAAKQQPSMTTATQVTNQDSKGEEPTVTSSSQGAGAFQPSVVADRA